jgi:uncharacterized membrane protein
LDQVHGNFSVGCAAAARAGSVVLKGLAGFYCTPPNLSCLLLPEGPAGGPKIVGLPQIKPRLVKRCYPGRTPSTRSWIMLKRAFFMGIALVFVGFALATPAEAGFRVCNRSDQRIDVAFGYPHTQFGWTSEGWWVLEPGQCRLVMRGNLTNRYYYLYAHGSEGGLWQAQPGQDGGFFCIQSARFVLQNRNFQRGNKLDCGAYNLQGKQFLVVDTEGAPNHVHNLRE